MKEIQDKQVNEKLETERKMNRLEELKQHYNLKRINQQKLIKLPLETIEKQLFEQYGMIKYNKAAIKIQKYV